MNRIKNVNQESELEIKKAFFEGYYDADGCKTDNRGLDKRLSFLSTSCALERFLGFFLLSKDAKSSFLLTLTIVK